VEQPSDELIKVLADVGVQQTRMAVMLVGFAAAGRSILGYCFEV